MIEDMESAALLCAATQVLPAEWRDLSALLLFIGSEHRLMHGPVEEQGREGVLWSYLRSNIDKRSVAEWQGRLERVNRLVSDMQFLTILDERYPAQIRDDIDHPPFIFLRGSLPDTDYVSIVGSRRASAEGTDFAYSLGRSLASQGLCIVSGLALGIDSAAHQGALSFPTGKSVAVIATGIDQPTYPSKNVELGENLVSSGGIISQFRPGSPPTSSSFIVRNTLISLMSRVSVVVEGGPTSGTRTEVNSALRNGRHVIAVDRNSKESDWLKNLARANPTIHLVENYSEIEAKVLRIVRNEGCDG